jgi:hypothetical protein
VNEIKDSNLMNSSAQLPTQNSKIMNFFKNNQKLIISIVLSFIAVSFMILLYYKFFKKNAKFTSSGYITQIIEKK